MVHYTNSKFADNYMYGFADGNRLEAKRLFEERFPNRNIPERESSKSSPTDCMTRLS